MTNVDPKKLLEEIRTTYNTLLEGFNKDITPTVKYDKALLVVGRKEGAEMAMVAICHVILCAYGIEADMEMSNGQTITLGYKRHD